MNTGKKIILSITVIVVLAAVGVAVLWKFSPNTLRKANPGLSAKLGQGGNSEDTTPAKIEDFHLLDQEGRSHFLHRQTKSKALVLISTANGCPVMKEAAPRIKALSDRFASQGVTFWMVDSNPQDDRASIANEAKALGMGLPILGDTIQLVASEVGFARTCEAVCINTSDWTVVYRGAIDDQLGDATKSKPAKTYLENALSSLLAGKSVSPNRTMAKGTAISFASATGSSKKSISYANEVAPILQQSCVACHSPHGSVNAKMLVARDANLCLRCHLQTTDTNGVIIAGDADHRTRLQNGTCWSAGCHEAIHGSNSSKPLRY